MAMKQIEVDSLVSMIDELQANYWRDTKKGKIVIVDTSYLLDKDVLPMYSPIVVPFQVMIELGQLKKRMKNRVKNVMTNINQMKNISFQPFEMRKKCQQIFRVKQRDNDGHILASALFMKKCYPFRKIYVYTNDKDLKCRCAHFEINTNV